MWAQKQPPPTFNSGLASNFFLVYRTLSMRQKTKNHRTQGSFDKIFDFFPQTLSHIPRWVRFVQKTRAKNSHAWAPFNRVENCNKDSSTETHLDVEISIFAKIFEFLLVTQSLQIYTLYKTFLYSTLFCCN